MERINYNDVSAVDKVVEVSNALNNLCASVVLFIDYMHNFTYM